MVEVRKRDKETAGTLARRFTRKVKYSGILKTARSLQFRSRPKSGAQKKKAALHREMRRKEIARLKKLGKMNEA